MPVPKQEYLSDIWKDGVFTDKVVFCTGGSGSICSAQVRALVYLGANACIIGRNVEKTERVAADIASARPGAKVLGIGAVDVRNMESQTAAVKRCVEELGGIDFVIAGAAGNFLAPIRALSANAFKSVVDIDLLGSFNTAKATLPYLIQSAERYRVDAKNGQSPASGTGGRIIFVSSNAHRTGLQLQTHVSVAKAGVNALSNNIAIELGPLGVTSNIISPGPIGRTEGMDRLTPQADTDAGKDLPTKIPLGRWGSVRDIADATVYLFSNAANYVNGANLVVDGGSWRTGGGSPGSTIPYPDFLLSNEQVGAARAGNRAKM